MKLENVRMYRLKSCRTNQWIGERKPLNTTKTRRICFHALLAVLLFLAAAFPIAEVNSNHVQRKSDISFSAINSEGSEYSSGSLQLSQDMNVWYASINQSTHVVFFTYYSKVYNSPIVTFLGQHYTTANNTEVFIGNTMLLMEAYNDTNGDSVPEADLGEIKYFFLVNSSETFDATPVQKTTIENVSHYVWGIEYGWVDGFFLYPKDQIINGFSTNLAARVNITRLSLTYDYYVKGNVSYIKTGFKIGKMADFEPFYVQNVSSNELGLSILYGTAIFTTNPYTVRVNGKSYDSRTAQASATSTNQTEVVVESEKIYEFIFQENYTLYRDSATENHTSKTIASPTGSLPPNSLEHLSWSLRLFSEDVFPKMDFKLPAIDLAYANSSLIYRVCYPTWDGWSIEHDPTYVAYLVPVSAGEPGSSGVPPPAGPSLETIVTAAVALAGTVALTLALVELRRTRRMLRISPLITSFRCLQLLFGCRKTY